MIRSLPLPVLTLRTGPVTQTERLDSELTTLIDQSREIVR